MTLPVLLFNLRRIKRDKRLLCLIYLRKVLVSFFLCVRRDVTPTNLLFKHNRPSTIVNSTNKNEDMELVIVPLFLSGGYSNQRKIFFRTGRILSLVETKDLLW